MRSFHHRSRTIDETVDEALNFGGSGYFRVSTIQIRSEILNLSRRVAALKPANILEIGTARGGTLFIWAQLASKHVVSCDITDLSIAATLYERFAPPDSACRISVLQGDSHDERFAAGVKDMFGGEPLDFLFIDGDHTEPGVRRDYELYHPLVRPGGLIAFHDIVEDAPLPENQVYQFWKDLRQRVEHEEIVESADQCGFGIGVVRVAA